MNANSQFGVAVQVQMHCCNAVMLPSISLYLQVKAADFRKMCVLWTITL